ncbi:MAG: hypothetical protein HUJ87_08420 [Fusobacterium varium]|nr:hypothetical protein [Fusobacterium varium]
MNKLLGWFITINLVNIFWVFFRARTLNGALKVLKGMFDIKGLIYMGTHIGQIGEITRVYRDFTKGALGNRLNLFILGISLIIVFIAKNTFEKNDLKLKRIECVKIILFTVIGILFLEIDSTFLYFNF